MLAPGDYLLKPPEEQPPAQSAAPPGERTDEPTQTTHQAAKVEEPESFLMILLRALGAIHT
jgi:hypothetical protein